MSENAKAQNTLRSRLYDALGRAGTIHAKRTLWLALLPVLLMGGLATQLGVSTSRHGLVDPDHPYQRRLLNFFDEFGYPDALIYVVSGGTTEQRRTVVDTIGSKLETMPIVQGRVLSRIGVEQTAPLLLLHRPQLVDTFAPLKGEALHAAMTAGIVRLTERLADRSKLEGNTLPSAADGGLAQLAQLMDGLSGHLEGRPFHMPRDQAGGGAWRTDGGGYLTSEDGTMHIVPVLPRWQNDEVKHLRPVVHQMRDLATQAVGKMTGVSVELTGIPAMSVDERATIKAGLTSSSVAAGVGILVLLFITFRVARLAVLALVPLLAGIVMTLGTIYALYGQLNLITSSFVSVLMGLGIDFAVHFLARFNEAKEHGEPTTAAVFTALHRAGPGILTGAVTTALAFMTTATTDYTAFAELGVVTSIGLLLMVGATFIMLPPLLTRFDSQGFGQPAPLDLTAYSRFVAKARLPIVALAVAGAGFGIWAVPQVTFQPGYFDFLPKETESGRGLGRLNANGNGGFLMAHLSADSVDDARRMTEALRKSDVVQRVESPSDAAPALSKSLAELVRGPIPPAPQPTPVDGGQLLTAMGRLGSNLAQAMQVMQVMGQDTTGVAAALRSLERLFALVEKGDTTTQGRLEAADMALRDTMHRGFVGAATIANRGHLLPTDLPEVLQARFASKDKQRVALYVYPKDMWQREGAAQEFIDAVEAQDPNASGIALSLEKHGNLILGGFREAAGLALGLIFLLLWWDFRSVRDALLALLPVVFAWCWTLGAMHVLGRRFDLANVVTMPLILGIGIDAGVHMVHRARQSMVDAAENSLADILTGTGSAVLFATLTTMMGFLALLLADYGAMKSLGTLMSLGIGFSMVGAVVLLPAVLHLVGRAR